MELVGQYIELRKSIHPMVTEFLSQATKVPARHIEKMHKLGFKTRTEQQNSIFTRIGRGSGRTGYIMDFVERCLNTPPQPEYQIQVSDEYKQVLNDPLSDAIQNIARRSAHEMERRLRNSIMYGMDWGEPSRVIRGRRSENMFDRLDVTTQLVGDDSGDVFAISNDSRGQT